MASVILLGLGLDTFSMSSFEIPEIKKIIRSTTMKEARELTKTVLKMQSYREINNHINQWMENHFDFISQYHKDS